MTRLVLAIAVFELVFSATAKPQTATAIAYKYAKVAFPGAISTTANGINNNNVIVGAYLDSASRDHGYVFRAGKFRTVDFPGATATEVLGINDNGDIVGVYQLPGPLNFHGFVRRNGDFAGIDVPAATFSTVAAGINNNGVIVGTYDDSQGFVFRDGNYTTWDAPQLAGEPVQTQLNGINNQGWIAGQVFSGGNWRGFWLEGSDLDFLAPLYAPDNEVTSINGRSDIVGCHDSASGFASFNVEAAEGSEKNEKFPRQQTLPACASAINFGRVIVGNNFNMNHPDAFLGVPALTLTVSNPANHVSLTNPVALQASAYGLKPVAQIQLWVNQKKVLQVSGATLSGNAWLPVGKNERVAIQASDSTGMTVKVVQTVTVQ